MLKEKIMDWLQDVKDPEIPSVSVVDMGMVKEIFLEENENVTIHMIPTFVGCPALDIIRNNIKQHLEQKPGVDYVNVKFVLDIPWTSDRINEEGRERLKEFGIAPPPQNYSPGDPWIVECPYCGSPKTVMDNLFGPTACRSILYCTSCKNPFEAIKPI